MSATSPKRLTLLYFASLAECAGKDEEVIEFAGNDPTELYQQLNQRYAFDLAQHRLAIAINHVIANWHTPLQDGDIVAFIPPVAGG
ncbi:MoaD/ThiS family protein [Moraxella atlantae]|uniref:MoaD/ThiS family protein n=1 Tax=Faucicola atlantae TaxID=34059 RepID=UPI0025B2139F|nr:MoaD/ThiS family protein [Moraxella atlantae]